MEAAMVSFALMRLYKRDYISDSGFRENMSAFTYYREMDD